MQPESDQQHQPRWRLPITAYLSFGLGTLVLIALGLLLWVTLGTIFKNTTELMEDKSRLLLGALTAQTRLHLDATIAPSNVVASEIASGRLDPGDTDQLMTLLRTLLAATPQIAAMAFFDIDETRVAAFRDGDQIGSDRRPWPDRDDIIEAIEEAKTRRSAFWGPPIYEAYLGPFLNLRRPVFKDGKFRGMVTAIVTVRALSELLGDLETEIGQNAFILYDRDYVLAHLALNQPFAGLSETKPLPEVTEIGDPVLFHIWRDGWQDNALVAGSGHADDAGDQEYIFLYAPLDDYADAPWLVGSYFTIDTIGSQFQRMVATIAAVAAILILTIIATYLFGRFLRKPIITLSSAATAIRGLDLDKVPTLPPSRFAELDDAGRAFNAMVGALRTFSLYVPQNLVRRLIARGHADAIPSEERDVTILLTDIVGFTSRAERMSAEETATFLNHHLALVTGCIEAEGGVVDKFMGDAVMALWGALDREPDQAIRAVQAAIRIEAVMKDDNRNDTDPVRLRIGIHSGPAVAGNIGTATRMNYTVVGDTVNMTQRLEALGKTVLPDNEVAILISAETARLLGTDIEVRSCGFHGLRGRLAKTEVFSVAGK